MRPINLIPEEERGLHGGVARTGPFVYILLGSMAVLLIGVVVLVLTSNKISERESEITSLEAQRTNVSAESSKLQPYVSFEKVADQRLEAVTGLANSRFDWERVIRQLAYILPPDAFLKVIHASSGGNGGGQFQVESPNLALAGCSIAQDSTAAVITAMKQIDGVTRVGLAKSTDQGEGGQAECPVGDYEFELTATFDEAPRSPDSPGSEVAPPTGTDETAAVGEAESTAENEQSAESSGETADASPAVSEGSG